MLNTLSKKVLTMINGYNQGVMNRLRWAARHLESLGWVDSLRKGATGVGYTCEALLGIKENNHQSPDFCNLIEIKTQRARSSSRITLFTSSPKGRSASVGKLVNMFGALKNEKKSLYTTINGLKLNSYKNAFGFKVVVDRYSEQINLIVVDLASNAVVLNTVAFYFSDLKPVVLKKISYLCLFRAKSRFERGGEQFNYKLDAMYFLNSFADFLLAIESGVVVMELRVGVRGDGSVHDHGTAWRVSKKNMEKLFSTLS